MGLYHQYKVTPRHPTWWQTVTCQSQCNLVKIEYIVHIMLNISSCLSHLQYRQLGWTLASVSTSLSGCVGGGFYLWVSTSVVQVSIPPAWSNPGLLFTHHLLINSAWRADWWIKPSSVPQKSVRIHQSVTVCLMQNMEISTALWLLISTPQCYTVICSFTFFGFLDFLSRDLWNKSVKLCFCLLTVLKVSAEETWLNQPFPISKPCVYLGH